MNYQTKLKNFFNDELKNITALEFIENINLDNLLEGIVLPPEYKGNKASNSILIKILIYKELKGINTIPKTLKILSDNPSELKVGRLPHCNLLYGFKSARLGKVAFNEIMMRLKDVKNKKKYFIRDNINEHKYPKNNLRINKKLKREVITSVRDFLLKQVKANKVINSSYSDKDIWKIILNLVCSNVHSAYSFGESFRESDNGEYKREKVCTGRTLLNRIRQMFDTEEDIQEFQYYILKKTIDLIRKYSSKWFNRRKFDLAIDCNSIPTWEDIKKSPNPADIVHDAHILQKGTTYFRRYITCSIVVSGFRFCLGFIPIKAHTRANLHLKVAKLVTQAKSLLPIRLVTMDKEFENLKVMNVLRSMRVKYVMPTKRTSNVVKIAKTSSESVIVTDRVINGHVVGKLIIIKEYNEERQDYDIMYYSTNIGFKGKDVLKVREIYKTRWGIETAYSDIKFFKALTTSRKSLLRTFYYGMGIVVFNLWIITNLVGFILFIKVLPEKPIISKKQFNSLVSRFKY